MVIIGVDVGLKATGYVICKVYGSNIELLEDGQILTYSHSSLPQRLHFIFQNLLDVIEKFRPQVLVLEKLYSHSKHPITLGLLAQVRGVVALLTQKYNLEFCEYSPTRTKNAILGRGDAKPSQVKKMVENLLGKKVKSQHIADAFSLVVAFSHNHRVKIKRTS
jgi:crossover junction endodeoxyribonuclease RuvC